MEKKMKVFKFFLLWIFSFFLTVFFSIYQRATGPTHPFPVKIKFYSFTYDFKLPRSAESGKELKIIIPIDHYSIKGEIHYRLYPEGKEWQKIDLEKKPRELTASLPTLPPAGKYEYYVKLFSPEYSLEIPEKPIKVRFKGYVPLPILIAHIIIIFSAFLFGVYSGLYTLFFKRKSKFVLITFLLFLIGGGVLGPIVQKYAFGQFWTGFPFGMDLTDNKGLILIIFWGLASFKSKKEREHFWIIIALLITILSFFTPHSLWGSELRGGKVRTGP